MMLKQVKNAMLTLGVGMLCNGAYAAQSDLDIGQIVALQEAYKHVQAQEYDMAKESYKKIQATDDIEAGLKRAAAEGEGLALLLDLNEQVSQAKDNKVKLRLLRFQRRTTVSYLEKAIKRHPNETLGHMLALAKEENGVSDKTFDGLLFSEEYKRLLAVKEEIDAELPEEQKIAIPNAPETKSSVVNDSKIPGARTTVIPNVKYRVDGDLNMRRGPGTNFDKIIMLTDSQVVTVIKSIQLSNGQQWFKINNGKKTGYAYAGNLVKVTKTTKPRNNTGAKTVKAPPPKTVQNPEKNPAQNLAKTSNANNKACGSGTGTWYQAKAKVKVFRTPGGSVMLSYNRGTKIKVVNILPSYWVIRLGPLSGNFKCGYIFKDNTSLKRAN